MDDLIKKLGLENATTEEKNKLLVQFTESLFKRLMARIYQSLDEEKQSELERLISAGDEKRLHDFLALHIPNLDEIRQEEMDNLIAELENFKKISDENK